MLLRDKIIFVFYIGVEDMPKRNVSERLCDARYHFDYLRDESTEIIFLPDFDTQSCRVEAINPKLLCDEDYCKVEEMVDNFHTKLKEWENDKRTADK